jgi:hypothetical protein
MFSSEVPRPAMGNRITSPKYASFRKPAFSATVCHGTENHRCVDVAALYRLNARIVISGYNQSDVLIGIQIFLRHEFLGHEMNGAATRATPLAASAVSPSRSTGRSGLEPGNSTRPVTCSSRSRYHMESISNGWPSIAEHQWQ